MFPFWGILISRRYMFMILSMIFYMFNAVCIRYILSMMMSYLFLLFNYLPRTRKRQTFVDADPRDHVAFFKWQDQSNLWSFWWPGKFKNYCKIMTTQRWFTMCDGKDINHRCTQNSVKHLEWRVFQEWLTAKAVNYFLKTFYLRCLTGFWSTTVWPCVKRGSNFSKRKWIA